uniref:Uncharacterized protein n=1 Tax=Amphimedon queenslandica TaxID=400682 RepID=A0A1X7SQX1_AMPQE
SQNWEQQVFFYLARLAMLGIKLQYLVEVSS